MARRALHIEVTKKDRRELKKLLSGGIRQVRVVLRAMALLQMAKGVSAPRIAGVVPMTPQAIRKVAHRYEQGGLERARYEKERTDSQFTTPLLMEAGSIRPKSKSASPRGSASAREELRTSGR